MTKRPLWMILVLLLATAAALWGAMRIDWGDRRPDGAGSLTALAVLALASVAGVFAVSGWMRRMLGAIIVVAGGYVCWLAVDASGGLVSGRGLALVGGLLFLAAGVLVVAYAAGLPTMSTRYERVNAERRSGDPLKDMWDGLSEGDDPTADEPRT